MLWKLASLLVVFGVGYAGWWLAIRRTRAVVERRPFLCAGIVLVEELLTLVVFAYLMAQLFSGEWLHAAVYSVGGSAGAWGAASRAA